MLVKYYTESGSLSLVETDGVRLCRKEGWIVSGHEPALRATEDAFDALHYYEGGLLDLRAYQGVVSLEATQDDGSIIGRITSWTDKGFGFVLGDDGDTYFLHLNGCAEALRVKLAALSPLPKYEPGIRVRFWDAGNHGEKYNVAEGAEEES